MRGRDLLAVVPRRLGRPGAWLDPQRVRADRQCPRGMCFDHTEHRYQLEVTLPDAQPDGPNVLVVGVNPTCPDVDSPGNQPDRQARRLGRGVQAASCGMVNLATLRTGEASDLLDHPASEIVGPRQGEALGWALSQADLVVLAHGRLEGRLADALASGYALLREHLAVEQVRGLIIAQVGDFPSHPWPWGTRIPGPDDALVSQLVQGLTGASAGGMTGARAGPLSPSAPAFWLGGVGPSLPRLLTGLPALLRRVSVQ